jgi:hypothetical protein
MGRWPGQFIPDASREVCFPSAHTGRCCFEQKAPPLVPSRFGVDSPLRFSRRRASHDALRTKFGCESRSARRHLSSVSRLGRTRILFMRRADGLRDTCGGGIIRRFALLWRDVPDPHCPLTHGLAEPTSVRRRSWDFRPSQRVLPASLGAFLPDQPTCRFAIARTGVLAGGLAE